MSQVVIWCDRFNVAFGTAVHPLTRPHPTARSAGSTADGVELLGLHQHHGRVHHLEYPVGPGTPTSRNSRIHTVRVTEKGQVTIPKELRDQLGL